MKKLSIILLICLIVCLLASCGGGTTETEAPETSPVPAATEGLEYAFTDSVEGCAVVGYKGSDTDIIIPDEFGGQKVTSVADGAFSGNGEITSVTLGANIKAVGVAAFAGCERLGAFYAGDRLEKIGNGAFFGCSSLSEVSLPSSLKSVGVEAFGLCENICEISYNGNRSMWSRVKLAVGNDIFNTELVLAEGGALVKLIAEGDCNANINWRLGYDGILYITGNGHIPDYEFGETPWGAYAESITSAVVEEGIDIVGKNCFIGCYNMESVSLAPTVRLIDDGAFYNCSSLLKIDLPERLRRIGENAFYGCASLIRIEIPHSVTAIGNGAFMKCDWLESVKLSSAVTEIGRWSFAECGSLYSIDLSSVVSIDNSAFFRCTSLGEITLSDKLTFVDTNAFSGCPKITVYGTRNPSITIKSGNESIK